MRDPGNEVVNDPRRQYSNILRRERSKQLAVVKAFPTSFIEFNCSSLADL